MEAALRKIVTERPFNNVGKLYHAVGMNFPQELGGNCVKLGEELIKVLLDEGSADDADLIDIEDDDSHAGVIAEKAGQRFYLDPGLMQLKPVCVSALPLRETAVVPTLPFIGGKFSDLEVKRLTPNRIGVTRVVNAVPRSFTFSRTFDLRETRRGKIVNDPYGVQSEVQHLLFRFCLNTGEVRIRCHTETGVLDCLHTQHSGETTIHDLEKLSTDGERLVGSVEEAFNISRSEIFKHLEGGLDLYREIVGESE